MRLAGRQWRTLVSTVRLGGDSYRVIRPARPLSHGSLFAGRWGPMMTLDKATTVDLAFAWWLAARSPRSMIYLPLRSSRVRCDNGFSGHGGNLDLVLLHHSLAFPVSRWKQVRARLNPAAAHTVTLPPNAFRTFDREEHWRGDHREFRDHLRWAVAADTVFVIGSRHGYDLRGDDIRELAEDVPAKVVECPDSYCCTEISLGHWKMAFGHQRNPPGNLHIDRCHEHWPAPAGGPERVAAGSLA